MPTLEQITTNLASAAVRRDTLEGREYLVAPVAMLAEGVHAGSHGPLYYPDDELGKNVESWNHRPIVVSHPKINGKGVSACSPAVLNKQKVGVIFNTTKDGKLRAEAWLDEERLGKVAPQVMAAIRNNQIVEVSTGLFTENEDTPGEWRGQSYVGVARGYRPDHLAILVGEKGAYSVEKGGGLLRMNSRGDEYFDSVVQTEFAFSSENPLTDEALVRNNAVSVARKSYQQGVLDAEATMSKKAKVDKLIANKKTRWTEADRDFLMTLSDEQVEKADPVESDDPNAAVPDNQGVLDRPDTPQKAGSQSPQAPTTPPPATDKPQQTPPPAQPPAQPPATPPPTQDQPKQNRQMTSEEWMAMAPPDIREVVSNGVSMYQQERGRLIGIITANAQAQFNPDWLQQQSIVTLKGLAALAQPQQATQAFAPPSYFGAATPASPVANAEEPLPLPVYAFKKAAS